METIKKELDRLAKIITDRAEFLSEKDNKQIGTYKKEVSDILKDSAITLDIIAKTLMHIDSHEKSGNVLKDIPDIFKLMGLLQPEFPTVVKVKAGENLKTGDVVKKVKVAPSEIEIDIENGKIFLPNGDFLKITESLKVRCGETNKLVFFKTPDGYIEDQTVITEFWDTQVDGGVYELFYSVEE